MVGSTPRQGGSQHRPLLPPLPSSLNKENSSNEGRSRASPQHDHPHSTFLKPATTQRPARSFKPVLRVGETMDSFFGPAVVADLKYRRLCECLVKEKADDPLAWKDVLQQATALAQSSASTMEGSDVLRMHRRATGRFADCSSSAIQDLWLSFADAQAAFGAPKDARLILRHLQTQGSAEATAALQRLDRSVGSSPAQSRPSSTSSPALVPLPKMESNASENPSPKRQKIEPSKFQAMMSGLETSRVHEATDDKTENSNMSLETAASLSQEFKDDSKDSIRFQLAPPSRKLEEELKVKPVAENKPLARKTAGEPATSAASKPEKPTTQEPTPVNTTPARSSIQFKSTRVTTLLSTDKGRSKRPPLLSKTPISTRTKGALGRPSRGTPGQAQDVDSDSDGELEQRGQATNDSGSSKPARKITKLDLSYMWAWDPNKPNGGNKSATKAGAPSMDKIEEAPPSTSLSTSSSTNSSIHSNDRSVHSTKMEEEAPVVTATAIQPPLQPTSKPDETNTQVADMIAKSNPDFLPLVSEQNMLRVNGTPYAKLGVIGRGGSCKVYRALSKDCSVLGIKKVKLDGMDKKAIDGYSNEIALLKRLRGNPNIIQMFDSEVDLARKAIFLVMELGEVDLNHVLQQQQRQSTGGRRLLNVNFIRLTWQQMLSAVHSIHEERIIHGDLKPANFLFVRGALKLIDFGIAKAIQSDDTTNIYRESQIGTLNYMSPESILDTGSCSSGARMKCGRASDIWSLGCILYQMVYGKTPFADLHMVQKLQAIVNPNYKIPFPEGVDKDAVDAVKLCLRRNPDHRPPIVGPVSGLLNQHSFLNSSRSTNA